MEEIISDLTFISEFIENILQNEPPYKKIEIDVKWYKQFINISKIAISSFCDKCYAESVFTADICDDIRFLMGKDVIRLHGGSVTPNARELASSQSIENRMKGKSYLLGIEMKCAKCGEKHYFSLVFNEDYIVKIGQYPSYSSVEAKNAIKYKNLISKYYPEFTRSINAFSQGMGVASFVYLRRILEHLVEKRFTGDQSLKFSDKLHLVEKQEKIIPDELEPIKNQIYSILSKGIHEYEEDECLELYLAVKFIIECILDLELEKKNKKIKALSAMSTIKNKLKEE